MTDNDIIKALECCGIRDTNCIECPYYEKTYCVDADALDLINRKDDMINGLIAGQETLQKALAEKNAEVERLTLENLQMVASIKRLKSEAITEFAERLKELKANKQVLRLPLLDLDIDNLVAELTEKNDFKE